METNNMNTRARFEEIWPVPEEIFWSEGRGEYWPVSNGPYDAHIAEQWDARLDAFTRCQETTAIHLSLIEDMIADLESCYECLEGLGYENDRDLVNRAKQIMEQKK